VSAAPVSRRAALDIPAQVVGRAANLLLGIAVTLVLVRTLGDRGFGAWATILTVSQLAAYLGQMGLEPAAVRRAAAEPARSGSWLGALVVVRFILTVPATVVAIVCVLVVSSSHDMALAGTLICLTLLLSAPAALRAVFQLRMRNDVPVAVATVNSVLWTGGAAGLSAAGTGMVGLATLFLVVAVVSTALLAALALRAQRLRLRQGARCARELLRVGIPLGIGGLLALAYARIDQILVFTLAGRRDAGLYAAVYRVVDQAEFVPISLTTTLLPLLSAAHPADPARLRRLLQLGLDVLAVASLPALAFAIVAAEPAVRLLFGPEFTDAAPALPVLVASYVLTCFGYLDGIMIVVLGLQGRLVAYAAAALVFNVGLNLVLIPPFGFLAAAWTTLATQLLVLGLCWTTVLRRIAVRLEVRRVLGAGAAALVMATIVEMAQAAGAPFSLLLAGAGATYLALLLAFRVVRSDHLRVLMEREEPA
jgi:O-antigen/teichoic acid export membrane protein